jgi:RimJ/RimL family protein N-acetyltransferase
MIGSALLADRASIRVLEKLGLRFERQDRDELGPVAIYVYEPPAQGTGAPLT